MFRTTVQLVVILTLTMVILLPFLGLHCGDGCPVCENDPQFFVISILCSIGMSIVCAALLIVMPVLQHSEFFTPSGLQAVAVSVEKRVDTACLCLLSPLRI